MLISRLLEQAFATIDDETKQYIESVVLNVSVGNDADLYDTIGIILHELAVEKSENDIRNICSHLLSVTKRSEQKSGDVQKVLDKPIKMAENQIDVFYVLDTTPTIFDVIVEDELRVDAKKLQRAEDKLRQKQKRRARNGEICKQSES